MDAPPPGSDRNLLFGILALQMELIDRDGLIAAMGAWALRKDRPLGEILVAQGALDPADRGLLEPMVARFVARHGGDPARGLAAARPDGETRASLGGIPDPEVQASLRHLGPGATAMPEADEYATATPSVGTPTSAGTRFRILRPLARGGLGVISVALDEELRREVALKEIRERHADRPDSRARFMREAEVTGALEHPGIIPVYGLGCYADGRPFYAMRLVRGESLREAILRHHRAEGGGRRPGRRALEFRKLLRRFLDTCDAMAYAHSRGVLHRDLKPENVMLGRYGETLVVDWGLAKVFGPAGAESGPDEPPVALALAGGMAETLAGSAVGTPAYMSPEQAAGGAGPLGPASDVYGLGATLYCLSTGHAPFEGTDVGGILHRVQCGDFPPPRRLDPTIAPALEAICLKAMALRPEDRYPSPRALAEDLEHWLADEPVAAARDPLLARLARWARGHRPAVAVAAALLVTATGASTIGAILIGREQARTNAEAEQLRRQDYVYRVNLALREVEADNAALAEDLLGGCPPDLRGWEWRHVRRLGHLDLLTYRGHGRNVQCLAMSPEGPWVVSGGGEPWDHSRSDQLAELRSWNAEAGGGRPILLETRGLTGIVQDVAISRDGKWVAAGGGHYRVATGGGPDRPAVGGWLALWEAATGKQLWARGVTGLTVTCVAFHPDGRTLIAGYGLHTGLGSDAPGRLERRDLATGEVRPGLPAVAGSVRCLAVDPAGRYLALAGSGGGGDGWLQLRDLEAGTKIRDLSGHEKWVYSLAFSADGTRLASGGWDRTVKVWDPATGAVLESIAGHDSFVYGVAFSPDGRTIASGGEDKSVRLWDAATGRDLAVFHGHKDFVWGVAFHPRGDRLLSASRDGTVKAWGVTSSRPVVIAAHAGWVSGVAFGADGRLVASEHDGRRVKAVEGDPNGADEVKSWDPETGRAAPRDPSGTDSAPRSFGRLGDLAATSGDGRLVAEVGDLEHTGRVEVKERATGRVLFTLEGHTGRVTGLAFSPDGRRLATASWDGTVKLWDPATGLEVLTLRGHGGGVNCVAFSPRGDRIASGGIDGTVRIWDATPLSIDDPPGPSTSQ